MFNKIAIVVLVVLFASCGLSNRDIEDHYWKLSDIRENVVPPLVENKHHIDHISFGESRYYYLEGDVIFREDVPYATIIKRDRGASTSIEIVQLDTRETLRYVGRLNR